MKQNKKWSMRIASFCLAGACLCGGAVLAAGGDESDPLVTLSYLTQTVTPNILKQVDEQAVLDTLGLAGNLETARLMELAARHDTAAALETLSRLLSAMSAGDRALFFGYYIRMFLFFLLYCNQTISFLCLFAERIFYGTKRNDYK